MENLVSKNLKEHYDSQYKNSSVEWRMLGARGKAKNIMALSKNIDFSNVLDVGSGDGSVLYWLSKYKFCDNITALEISQSGIDVIKKRDIPEVKNIKMFDGYQIPFEDNSFDLAMCSHVIEHVEHPRILIREIKRVSKNQIFEVPIDFSFSVDDKIEHYLSYGHVNIFSPQTFRFLLKTEGLNIIDYKNSMYEKEALDYENRKRGTLQKLKTNARRIIWNNIDFLRKIKPNVTTVLTSKNDRGLEIMSGK